MTLLISLIVVTFITFCASKEPECFQKNTSCEDIKIADGYQYVYSIAPNGSEIELYYNKTLIGHGGGKHPFEYEAGVIRMDTKSVITRSCLNLTLKFFVSLGGDMITERCLEYEVTEDEKKEKEATPPLGIIIGLSVAGAVLIIIGFLCRVYFSRTTQPMEQQSPTCPNMFQRFSVVVVTCSHSTRDGISQARDEGGATRNHSDNQPIGLEPSSFNRDSIRQSAIHSDTDPHESTCNEYDDVQSHTHGSERLHSIDPGTDGKTREALSPDHNLSNGGTQLSNDITSQCIGGQVDLNPGTKSVPDINAAWNHRAMNRNLRDDPGGLNGDKGEDTNIRRRDMPNDWTPGDQSPEEHDSEGQPLLSERTAMTGEPIALVIKRGLDPDQVIGCSIAPDKGSTDVESTSLMIHKV